MVEDQRTIREVCLRLLAEILAGIGKREGYPYPVCRLYHIKPHKLLARDDFVVGGIFEVENKSRPAVANALRLLNLCPDVLEKVRSGQLSAGHARAVLSLKTEKQQKDAAQKIIALGLSVRQAELLCKNIGREKEIQPEPPLKVDYIGECEKQLSKHLGRGVKIVNGKRKGRFELEFYGQDDLQTLLDALLKLGGK